jgi:hypothetical protein
MSGGDSYKARCPCGNELEFGTESRMMKYYFVNSLNFRGVEKFFRTRTAEEASFDERVEECVRHISHEVYQCPHCQKMVHVDEITGRLNTFEF